MVENLSDEKRMLLFQEFHSGALKGAVLLRADEERKRFSIIKLFYDTDDIFRREIDHLKEKMKKGKPKLDVAEKKVDELVKEAEYRRYVASFENMKKNYEARKNEMTKIKNAFS